MIDMVWVSSLVLQGFQTLSIPRVAGAGRARVDISSLILQQS